MKEVLLDANFPRTADGSTYHVGTKPGEVANRIIVVGDHVRARRVAAHLDGGKALFKFESQRKFLTLTGTYKGTPLSVISIGMGFSLVDFFLREVRAVVSGELLVVRLGSCGSLTDDVGIGSVVVPISSFGVLRNYDAFHPDASAEEEKYVITRPLDCDQKLHDALLSSLESSIPSASSTLFNGSAPKAVGHTLNASTDSFYSSQGRQSTLFKDDNASLIQTIQKRHPRTQTFEMETFVLNHLAFSHNLLDEKKERTIRTGAVQMIFANRETSAFITPDEVEKLELWSGKAVCEALVGLDVPAERLHGSGVWDAASSA